MSAEKLGEGTWEFSGAMPPESMPDWYRSLEVLVLPSHATSWWQEQFGRAAAEAMACGVPVIGARSGFIPELVETTGGGVLHPEGDVPALGEALVRLCQDPGLRRDLGQRGRQGVLEHYSAPVIAARTLGLIRGVAGDTG